MILMIVLAVLGAWLLGSVLLALVIGRTIRIADRNHRRTMAYRAAAVHTPAPTRTRTRVAS